MKHLIIFSLGIAAGRVVQMVVELERDQQTYQAALRAIGWFS